jgi:hypothetical protein
MEENMLKPVFRNFIVAALIAVTPLIASSAPAKKNAPVKIKFTGTIIDNKSLKAHKDSLSVFIPQLTKETVYRNVAYGYSLYTVDGKIYNLCKETVGCLWNDIKNPRGGSSMASLKISGNARIIGDSIRVMDFVVVK